MNQHSQTLREKSVSLIIKIQDNFSCISRNCVFLAVSIFDQYLQKTLHSWEAEFQHPELYAIVCLALAWKFEGDSHPPLPDLLAYLNIQMPPQSLRRQILELEQKILIGLDFCLPSSTAYQNLDLEVGVDELGSQQKRRDVAKSIKIILTAIKIGCQLSLDPSLGGKIHQITKKFQVNDCRAKNIYRKCLKFIKNQMENTARLSVCGC